MKKTSKHTFQNGATGAVIYVQLFEGSGPKIRAILSSGLIELSMPDPSDTGSLLGYLSEILNVPVEKLEVAGIGVSYQTGRKENMIAILGMTAAEADARLLAHHQSAR